MAFDVATVTGKQLLPKILGRVAIGEKDDAKGFPKSVDHFLFTEEVDPKTKRAAKNRRVTDALEKVYGTKKITRLRITMPFDRTEDCFFMQIAKYKADGWVCRSLDGQTATRKIGLDQKCVKCDYQNCDFKFSQKGTEQILDCKPSGTLYFWILDAPVSGGYWKFTTRGKSSIDQIKSTLQQLEFLRGTLFGLELELVLTFKQMQVVVNGKKMNSNVPTVSLEIAADMKAIACGANTAYGVFDDIKKTIESRKQQTLSMGHQSAMENDAIAPAPEFPEASRTPDPAEEVHDAEIVDSNKGEDDEFF